MQPMQSGICYLCGGLLSSGDVNEDHIFQQQFLKRSQPKSKEFDYGGVLRVHKDCNNLFGKGGQGPESICKKALQLLSVMHSKDALQVERKDNPSIRLFALNSRMLPGFTRKDLEYFKFNDVSQLPYKTWSAPDFYTDKVRINPFRVPTNVALSTLAKSAAGFLVKRYSYPLQSKWRILAIPHIGQNGDFSLNAIFGGTKPLEVGISLWIKKDGNGWFVAYKHDRFLCYFLFESDASQWFQQAKKSFSQASCLFFDSDQPPVVEPMLS